MQHNRPQKIYVGMAGAIIIMLLVLFFTELEHLFFNFSQKYLNPENNDEAYTLLKFRMLIFLIMVTTFIVTLFYITGVFKVLSGAICSCVDFKSVANYFLSEDQCTKNWLGTLFFTIGSTTVIVIHFLYLFVGKPIHEGIIEEGNSLLLLISSLLLIFSALKIRKLYMPSPGRRKSIIALIILSVFFLLIFGEEVSWGQRIFSWEPGKIYDQYNFQSETNLHNFFNPLNKFIYPLFGVSLFVFLFLIWFFPVNKRNYFFNLLIPHQSLFFMVLMLACSTFYKSHEPFEEMFAIFTLLYGLRVFICLKYPNNKPINQDESKNL